MYCYYGAVNIAEKLDVLVDTPMLDVVRIVAINGDDEVLLVKEFDDENWKLPGGKIHEGETVHAAIIREVEEELGFLLSNSQIKGYVKKTIPHSENYRHIVLAEITDNEITETKEVVERIWAKKDQIPPGKFQEHIRTAIEFVT